MTKMAAKALVFQCKLIRMLFGPGNTARSVRGDVMPVTIDNLARILLFSELDERTLQTIALRVHERTFEAGEMIVFEGDPCQGVNVIAEGRVWVRRFSPHGREYVFDQLGPGEFFNLVPALDGGASLATVNALTDTRIYVFDCDSFRQLMHRYPRIATVVMGRLAVRVRRLSDTVESLALYPVRSRLARFLLCNVAGGDNSAQWTQERVASHIGTVRDVVGRTLRALAQDGLIRRERGRLVVTDLDGLREEAMRE
jgi:CRP/FNR family transcriptional regulator